MSVSTEKHSCRWIGLVGIGGLAYVAGRIFGSIGIGLGIASTYGRVPDYWPLILSITIFALSCLTLLVVLVKVRFLVSLFERSFKEQILIFGSIFFMIGNIYSLFWEVLHTINVWRIF